MSSRLSGFGLVELLVSMALGLLLTMALMQTLLGSGQAPLQAPMLGERSGWIGEVHSPT